MRTWFDARTGFAVASLILLGWTLGSTLMPPVARTETPPQTPTPARRVETAPAPRVPWPPRRAATAAPHAARNPFVFERAASTPSARPAAVAAAMPSAGVVDDAATAAIADRAAWRLAGLAAGPGDAFTAILSGAAGVQLARTGDTLPDGGRVLEVTAERVRLADAGGVERVLVLR